VYLVCLVYLVDLVCLVYLVTLVDLVCLVNRVEGSLSRCVIASLGLLSRWVY